MTSAFFKHVYLSFFASIVVGFWYFTMLASTFYASFKQNGRSKWTQSMESPFLGKYMLIEGH
jgi:hypothetical protein